MRARYLLFQERVKGRPISFEIRLDIVILLNTGVICLKPPKEKPNSICLSTLDGISSPGKPYESDPTRSLSNYTIVPDFCNGEKRKPG
jgi:hypothetical protein